MNLLVLLLICRSNQDAAHVIYALFGDLYKSDLVYYGTVDLDKSEYNIISTLNIDDVGNPRRRKYQVLPLTYDPSNDIVFMSGTDNMNRTVLSVINATSGILLRKFNSIPYNIVSLQYDIFHEELFAHIETNTENVTRIVEIDTSNGNLIRVLAEISGAKPTDISTYCPICRKYFFIMLENNYCSYLAVDTSNGSGISWRVPLDFTPINIRFTYKTFTMYSTYVNRTDKTLTQVGIVNRTSGGISQVVGTISDQPNLTVTHFSTFDIANMLYYTSDVMSWPFSRGISYVNVNTSESKRFPLPDNDYNFYAWFIKQFVQ